MKKETINFDGYDIPLYSLNTLIIGSGAAALSAALNLFDLGQEDIAIVTEEWAGGTSYNAGSDKQTYYKISLYGDQLDSPRKMAEDLFKGRCMHGDIALCEAQNSLPAFFNLVRLGVPFPHDRYGAYVGYKTDFDSRGRATSAGPLTSHLMCKALAREIEKRKVCILDQHQVIALLTEKKGEGKHVIGAVALDKKGLATPTDSGPGSGKPAMHYKKVCFLSKLLQGISKKRMASAAKMGSGFVLFNARNVILGTGGPAGMYETSVYPKTQTGSTGLAFEIGAVGQNLTESQFGLASISFRWNLSGTYQQVIPRYISTDKGGGDEQEFLNDFFPDMGKLATAIFLKGYQWPFDPRKIKGCGSSLVDLLVYRERVVKGRRVFLDFTKNPTGSGNLQDFSFDLLEEEAREYLEKSGALLGTPIERLLKMNPQAAEIYKDHGIDLTKDYVEIAVCNQHNNGGLKGNIWWESNIKHLFPVGEVNGSHGVYRPGGSALNSGQVGGMRAAEYISRRYKSAPKDVKDFMSAASVSIKEKLDFASRVIDSSKKEKDGIQKINEKIWKRMSQAGAHIRNPANIDLAISAARKQYHELKNRETIRTASELPMLFKILDLCLTHILYLEAIGEYLEQGGKSRGSYLVLDPKGELPCKGLEDRWRFSLNKTGAFVDRKILEISMDENLTVKKKWVAVRPIPVQELWFDSSDWRTI